MFVRFSLALSIFVAACASSNAQTPMPFVTSQNPGAARNNTTGSFGMQFTVGNQPLVATQVGRMCVQGNSGTHAMNLYNTDSSGVNDAAAVSMASCTPGSYVYAPLATPLVMQANATYNLLSQETAGGDSWDDWGHVSSTSDATIAGMAYILSGASSAVVYAAPGYTFGPVNFLYTVGPGSSQTGTNFLSKVNLGAPRNNTTGWFGMKFTTGTNPVAVNQLARYCMPGNSGLHQLLLSPVSGFKQPISVWVSMAGCTPGALVSGYTYLGPVTLDPNTAYTLLSHETAGGDTWADWGTVASTPDGVVNGLAYSLSGDFAPVNIAYVAATNYAYGSVNFRYGGTVPSGFNPATSITSPVSGSTVSGSVNVTAAVQGNTWPIQSQRFFVDNALFTPPLNTAALPNGKHFLETQAIDTQGLSAVDPTDPYVFSINGAESYLLASAPQSSPRNDTTGWFGMQLSTGAQHVYVSHLGRACISSGQPSSHVLTLAGNFNPPQSFSMPLATVTVSVPATCSSPFVYAKLSTVVDLAPNSTYLVLSQETAGGAPWHDWGTVTPKSVATADGLSITGMAWALGTNPPTVGVGTGDTCCTYYPIYSVSPGANYSFAGLDLGYYVPQIR